MNNIAIDYHVKFTAEHEDGKNIIAFIASDPNHINTIISALSIFYSGDEQHCYIDGQEAVLDGDWGLL